MDATRAGLRTPLPPPTGLEVKPQPPDREHGARLTLNRGARRGLAFSTSGNYDANEKSVNQRVTRGQEDGFDTLLQLQSSLSL